MIYRDRIVSFLRDASRQHICFDSDPSNFICDTHEDKLVIIDPTCEDMDLQDFCMVVFLVGLIKCFAKSCRFGQFKSCRKCWLSYYRDYLHLTGASYRDLNAEISRYIRRIVFWNIAESSAERLPKRVLRFFTLVPGWLAIALSFKANLIRP